MTAPVSTPTGEQSRMLTRQIREALTRAVSPLKAAQAEVLTALCFVAGWLLVTLGLAHLARPDVVWPLSLGLLGFSLGGWKLLYTLVSDGLYALTRKVSNG